MTYRHTIRYSLHTAHKDGRQPVRMRVSWDCRRVDLYVGIVLEPKHWDAVRERVRTSHPDHGALNADLRTMAAAVDDLFAKAYETRKAPTKAQIAAAVTHRSSLGSDITVAAMIDAYIDYKTRRMEWQPATRAAHMAVANTVRRYNPNWLASDIEDNAVTDYIRHRHINNSSLIKECDRLREAFQWAERRGLVADGTADLWRRTLKVAKNEPLALSLAEVRALAALDLPTDTAAVRDAFLLQCLTGLRVSDIYALRRSAVRDGALHIVDRKTSDVAVIALNAAALAIVERQPVTGGRLFHLPTMPTYNAVLRRIACAAGISGDVTLTEYRGAERVDRTVPRWQAVSSHCGRRTFVSIATALGIPPEVVSKWTGHNQIDTMRRYLSVSVETAAAEMARFDSVLAPVGGVPENYPTDFQKK